MEEERQPGRRGQVTERQAARSLWEALTHSGYYKEEYGGVFGKFRRFAQLEQIYICMVLGVKGAEVQEVLDDKEISESERTKALETLWVQGLRKPQMPSEEQDRKIKEMNAYVQRLELQVTQVQADMSRIKTDRERGPRIEEDSTAVFFEEPDGTEEKTGKPPDERAKPAKRQRNRSSPFKELKNSMGPGSLRVDILESRVAELTEKLASQEQEIARLKTEGTQVRGIVITPPETGGAFKGHRRKRMLESEREKIDSLLAGGYAADQLDFLLQCREEGVPWETIAYFDGKDIPVELMRKLKEYYTKQKGVPESGTKEGGTGFGQ